MADGFIRVPVDSTGKIVDTTEITVGVNTVERQRINISDPVNAAGLAQVLNSAPAGTEQALVVRPIVSGTQTVSGTISVSTTSPGGATANASYARMQDGTTTTLASVGTFHNNDQQVPPSSGGSLLTGGVPQLTDPVLGLSNRQRQAGQDGVAALGQLAIPLAQEIQGTINSGNLTASTASPGYAPPSPGTGFTVTPASMTGWKVGAIGQINDANPELFEVVSVTSTTANIIGTGTSASFKFTHTAPYTYNALFLYNQERDFAGEGPCVAPSGAAVAVEFESNSGGPPLSTGLPSGFTLDCDRNLQGKGVVQMGITATSAGASTITFTGNPWTSGLVLGQPLLLSVGASGAAVEEVIVSKNNIPATGAGPTVVNLATNVVNASSTFATFDIFALNGPALNPVTSFGIEDNAMYVWAPSATDPKRSLYLVRAADQDNQAPQNLPLEGLGLVASTTVAGTTTTGNVNRLREVFGTGEAGVSTGGQKTVAIAAGTVGNTTVKATAGRLASVLVTALGTNAMQFTDGVSGTIIGQLAASAAVGTIVFFQMPAANSIVAVGNAANPAVTVSFS